MCGCPSRLRASYALHIQIPSGASPQDPCMCACVCGVPSHSHTKQNTPPDKTNISPTVSVGAWTLSSWLPCWLMRARRMRVRKSHDMRVWLPKLATRIERGCGCPNSQLVSVEYVAAVCGGCSARERVSAGVVSCDLCVASKS